MMKTDIRKTLSYIFSIFFAPLGIIALFIDFSKISKEIGIFIIFMTFIALLMATFAAFEMIYSYFSDKNISLSMQKAFNESIKAFSNFLVGSSIACFVGFFSKIVFFQNIYMSLCVFSFGMICLLYSMIVFCFRLPEEKMENEQPQ